MSNCAVKPPSFVTRSLNALDAVVTRALGVNTCTHQFGAWSAPVENRADKVGAFKVIKKNSILLSHTRTRECTKCGKVQTQTTAHHG